MKGDPHNVSHCQICRASPDLKDVIEYHYWHQVLTDRQICPRCAAWAEHFLGITPTLAFISYTLDDYLGEVG
jgi:hypothetical protein